MTHCQTILVLDDDSATRDFLHEVLSEVGYRVQAVGDVAGARTALSTIETDLLLCDHWLPDMSGLAFAKELRQLGQAMPIVLLTADHEGVQQLDLGDITFCLLKPFGLDELLDCVATYIRRV